jgi:xylulose-5-phosphate/fructose-6-phosphate phosphoketolase
MLYLQKNPLLREPLKNEDVKPRLLGHWGSVAAAYLARTALADPARRLCRAARSLAGRAWGALRRALPRLVLCVT